MNTRIMLKTIGACGFILMILSNVTVADGLPRGTTDEFQPVDSDRIPEILNMISTTMRTNYNQIKTWRGEVRLSIDRISDGADAEQIFKKNTHNKGEIPAVVLKHEELTIEFALNVKDDFLFVNQYPGKPRQYIDFETKRDLGAKWMPDHSKAIVTPEYYLQSSPNIIRENVVLKRKAVKTKREKGPSGRCGSSVHPIYEPRDSFGARRTIWELFPRVAQYMNENGELNVDGHSLKVEERKDGDVTRYLVQQPTKIAPEMYRFLKTVFCSENGFNIVSYELTDSDGKLLRRLTWEYELVSGVYLPKKTTEERFERTNGGQSYYVESTFRNLQLNQPIAEETFTYKNLGLQNGDKFIDKILNKEYTYQDEELIPVSNK